MVELFAYTQTTQPLNRTLTTIRTISRYRNHNLPQLFVYFMWYSEPRQRLAKRGMKLRKLEAHIFARATADEPRLCTFPPHHRSPARSSARPQWANRSRWAHIRHPALPAEPLPHTASGWTAVTRATPDHRTPAERLDSRRPSRDGHERLRREGYTERSWRGNGMTHGETTSQRVTDCANWPMCDRADCATGQIVRPG